MKQFDLTDADYDAIRIAVNTARNLLKSDRITAQQVIGLGHALRALELLPQVSPGIALMFGIVYRHGTKEFRETRFVEFRLSDEAFEISQGGTVFDEAVGSDSISAPGWVVEINGYREECELYGLENQIIEYLRLGAEIVVSLTNES